jgi:hypothetical protein
MIFINYFLPSMNNHIFHNTEKYVTMVQNCGSLSHMKPNKNAQFAESNLELSYTFGMLNVASGQFSISPVSGSKG